MNNSGAQRKRAWVCDPDDLRSELKRRKKDPSPEARFLKPEQGSGAKNLAFNRMKMLREKLEEERLKGITSGKPSPRPQHTPLVTSPQHTSLVTSPQHTPLVTSSSSFSKDVAKPSVSPKIVPETSVTRIKEVPPSTPPQKVKVVLKRSRDTDKVKCEPPSPCSSNRPSVQERLKLCRSETFRPREVKRTETVTKTFFTPPSRSDGRNEFRRCSEPFTIDSHRSPMLAAAMKEANNNDGKSTASIGADDEEMDWAPINEDELVSDIKVVRETLAAQFEREPVRIPSLPDVKTPKRSTPSSELYIVVDTNVFIHRLPVVGNIINITFQDKTSPIVYVPWMVFQELDYIKDGYNKATKENSSRVKDECVRAIQFIHKCLMSQRNNLKTESVHEATKNKFRLMNPDDYILSSCMNLVEQKKQVMLLSADMNLRSKALVNDLRAFHPNDVMQELKLMGRPKKSDKIRRVSEAMARPLTAILYVISTPAMRSDPLFARIPMPFFSCLKFMKSRFDDVLRDKVHKHCQKVIDELLEMQTGEFNDESNFINSCFALMMYLKTGIPEYESQLTMGIKEIEEIIQKY